MSRHFEQQNIEPFVHLQVGVDLYGGIYKSMVNNMMNFVKEFRKNTSLER
jgi:hypothetical protein